MTIIIIPFIGQFLKFYCSNLRPAIIGVTILKIAVLLIISNAANSAKKTIVDPNVEKFSDISYWTPAHNVI